MTSKPEKKFPPSADNRHRFFLIRISLAYLGLWLSLVPIGAPAVALQTQSEGLEKKLKEQDAGQLATRVMERGDAARGALLYFNPELTCVRCHEPSATSQLRLGPALAEVNRDATVEFLIQSLLEPSREMDPEFQAETILTLDGKQHTGLIVDEDDSPDGTLTLVDTSQNDRRIEIAKSDIDQRYPNQTSAMPEGLIGALPDEQSFLDLVRYLVAIKRGGKQTVLKLRPPESFFAVAPLPAYESNIDHAGLIQSLDRRAYKRGQAIYHRYCARCHGTRQQEGSMPSALRFADQAFKNGNDPYSMYETLTHGYGLMVAQRWMVPRQKYDVIHYIREHFLEGNGERAASPITGEYLASLPKGSEFGPDPVTTTPWSDMDYGNFLINTYEVGRDGTNIAYKGIAVRLDAGPGGVTQGRHWILYEHDTMRVAAAWSGKGFIDYNGIHFNDRHNVHPRIVGKVHFHNDHRPGWANPANQQFSPDPRIEGRDEKKYGPLPESWLNYRGLYQFGDRVVLDYTVGETSILESPTMEFKDEGPVFHRTLNLSPRPQPLLIKLASTNGLAEVHDVPRSAALFVKPSGSKPVREFRFDGRSYLETKKTIPWDRDMTVAARIKTGRGGTIICQTEDQSDWVPGGTSWFIRGGKLVFDIGWVGAVTSNARVDDQEWHDVALVWQPGESLVKLFIDGRLDQTGELDPGEIVDRPVTRIGRTAENFPNQSMFRGQIAHLAVFEGALSGAEIRDLNLEVTSAEMFGHWSFEDTRSMEIEDQTQNNHDATWITGDRPKRAIQNLWAAVRGIDQPQWKVADGSLCLEIPAGPEPLAIRISMGSGATEASCRSALAASTESAPSTSVANLKPMTRGGPPRYPDVLSTSMETLAATRADAFRVDVLNRPTDNPWACRLRLTGIDFVDDNTAVICSWDGSVWEVNGLDGTTAKNRWRRIAHGLFQPLGICRVDGTVFVTCRDQLVALEDLNGDGFYDFYRCFNSDHQVTEHFHEFAMGLQADAEGNFYYAKSARHAKTALVPHHGTLLKVAADGSDTEILANGFRAANGVCLNPDGTFFVTDQEGHWTPKNRINWVRGEGGFYGNMMGYHDVNDDSDEAMVPPLCWITNAFDRSPGELLWVPKGTWGPLEGRLLNLSYGMGQIFVVPHEGVRRDGQSLKQGGMCALPLPIFPTGVMRGRFHSDGHLYGCGMYAWAGNQQKPGGLYRIRYTGNPAYVPVSLNASDATIAIEFESPLDAESVSDLSRYAVRTWDIHRTANYGSPHLNEQELEVRSARLRADGRTVELTIPDLSPTRCMEIKCLIHTDSGRDVVRTIHNTIHVLPGRSDRRP